jgi:hypothetical protein
MCEEMNPKINSQNLFLPRKAIVWRSTEAVGTKATGSSGEGSHRHCGGTRIFSLRGALLLVNSTAVKNKDFCPAIPMTIAGDLSERIEWSPPRTRG